MNSAIRKLLPAIYIFCISGCIRDEVLLPPVVEPFVDVPLVSNSIASLKGNYFDATAQVVINDTAISAVGEPTLTEIKFIVPTVRSPRQSILYVKTKFGASNSIEAVLLPPVPVIDKVIPAAAGGGKTIKLVGRYFSDVTSVVFKSSSVPRDSFVTEVKAIRKDTIDVVVPGGLPRDAAEIRVHSSSGRSGVTPFTVLIPPKITSVSPNSGGAGTLINISGNDFDFLEYVRFGSLTAEVIMATSTTLNVRVPDEAATDTIYVSTAGGVGKSPSKFVITGAPEINSVDKTGGSVGTEVTITGKNFQSAFDVKFGNTPATIISNSGLVIKTRIPPGAQSGKISVTTPAGTGQSKNDFIVHDAPLVSSFSPLSGSTTVKIILNGFNLSAINEAKIGLKSLNIISKSDNQMEVSLPADAVTGKISVISPGGTYETATSFVVTGTPQITAVNPTSGVPGTIVTISGSNLPANPAVKFNNVQATVNSNSPTQIVCQVPDAATTGKVTVNAAVSPADFVIATKPTITSVVPMRGGAEQEITINGKYLTGASVTFFNNITAVKIGSATDNKIVVKVPATASSGKVTVTTAYGNVSTPNNFEVLLPPTISSFSPLTGSTGTPVVINGTNLHHNPIVKFFNQVNAIVTSISPTQLIVQVPSGAATGKLTIKTDAINSAIATASTFTVAGKPTVASISPPNGTIHEKVTITGTNLGGVVSVSFDGVTTNTILFKSGNSVQVRVPASVPAISDRVINVNVRTEADVSGNLAFTLLGTPTITKVSPDNNPNDWAFLIEGTNLLSVKKVSVGGKIPDINTTGIDQKNYNYLTTKVPKDVAPGASQKLMLFYTSDDVEPLERNYNVLSAPPQGVFPPPMIILPPPLPVTYTQTDLSNYWIDVYFQHNNQNPTLSCYQLRATFVGEPTGDFCEVRKFTAEQIDGKWTTDQSIHVFGSGSWNNGDVSLLLFNPNQSYTGRVFDKDASKLVLNDENGRQLVLIMDTANRCFEAHQASGPCD